MDLALVLNHQSETPLHRQVYEELRQAILSGRLLPGQRIPSTRSLSQSLAVSRTTITQGYEQLLSEGYLETRHGSGTFVCAQLPDDLLQVKTIPATAQPINSPIQLSGYAQYLIETPFALQPEPTVEISFRYGRPALEHVPIMLWRKLLSRHCCQDFQWLNYATDPQGYYPLRDAIARYLSRARAVQCHPTQIMITNGTQQALDLVLRVLIKSGDTIALEDPGYLSARKVFLSHGANLIPVPVDELGLQAEKLAYWATSPIRLVYVTPSHQFPTGATLSLSRRLELLNWAQQTGALILEDDYDSEYRYGDRPIPALQGLDHSGSVLYIGTCSKVLFPSLRIGYLVLPPNLVPLIAHAKWLNDRQLPMLEQLVLTDFIEEGHLERHIRKMRAYYDRRRQALVQALQQSFGERAIILGEKAGIHVMVRFLLPISEPSV
jgi:GntR family transcriptional regulator / MocR family aminotransferase